MSYIEVNIPAGSTCLLRGKYESNSRNWTLKDTSSLNTNRREELYVKYPENRKEFGVSQLPKYVLKNYFLFISPC